MDWKIATTLLFAAPFLALSLAFLAAETHRIRVAIRAERS